MPYYSFQVFWYFYSATLKKKRGGVYITLLAHFQFTENYHRVIDTFTFQLPFQLCPEKRITKTGKVVLSPMAVKISLR